MIHLFWSIFKHEAYGMDWTMIQLRNILWSRSVSYSLGNTLVGKKSNGDLPCFIVQALPLDLEELNQYFAFDCRTNS